MSTTFFEKKQQQQKQKKLLPANLGVSTEVKIKKGKSLNVKRKVKVQQKRLAYSTSTTLKI